MLTVKELAKLASSLKPSGLRKQLGPFVLVQRPDEQPRQGLASAPDEPTNPWGEPESTNVARAGAVADGTLALLFQFDALEVATLPPLQGVDELLVVGRQADCDLVINHGSVSKRHAALTWDAAHARAAIRDLGSRNGTFINAGPKLMGEVTLHDGDIVSFGEVQFWYLLTESLHERLSPGPSKLPRGV